jgi:hypothetical protein
MRDSVVGDSWIQQTAQANPVHRVVDKDGKPTGDICTGPVRLCFVNLDEPGAQSDPTKEGKYGAALLFTPYADMSIFNEEYYKILGSMFPEYYDQASQQYHGLQSPFHNQAEKMRFGGFTPGLTYMNCTSKYKPPVVDPRFNPIVNLRDKAYAGVWAICTVKPYGYGKQPPQPKKGVAFGLQSVMIIGDDTRLGGGAPDAKTQFSGVNVNAPIVQPNMSNMPQHGAPAPAGIPGYTAPQNTAHMHAPAPHVPQTHYAAPSAPAPLAGAPAAGFVPPPPGSHGAPAATQYTPPTEDDDTSFLNV